MNEVNKYLNSLAAPQKIELERVRKIVANTAPEAIEVISYGMPGFNYKNKYLITYSAFKDHLSIFPGSAAIEEFKEQLKPYKLSKGTIQFTIENPLPDKLLTDIVMHCVKRIDG